MPIPGVPAGVRRAVLEAFILALKADPGLANRRAVRTWITWDGRSPTAEPTVDAMPAVRVRLLSGPVKRLASTRRPGGPMTYVNESHPTVLIEVWTAGTDAGDQADVADLIVAALAPREDGPRAVLEDRLKRAGIKDWQLIREILPGSTEAFDLASVSGQGAYELTVFTDS